MPKTADSANSANPANPANPNSLGSSTRAAEEAITMLRARIAGQKAALLGFDVETKDPVMVKMGRILKTSVSSFLKGWYGLNIVSAGQKPDIIICNEATPAAIMNLAQQIAAAKSNASIVVLCSHNSRYDRTLSLTDAKCNVSFVAKPVGPLKLAKAIANCLDGPQPSVTPGAASVSTQPESSDLSNVFEGVLMSPQGGEVLDNTRMAADSDNARKALESPTPNALIERFAEFPFPAPTEKETPESKELPLDHSLTLPTVSDSLKPTLVMATTERVNTKVNLVAKAKIKFPTLLVVDDNQINLSLLSTYLNRRKYETVHEAQNGLEAVQQFERRLDGYDIIFMDITMPILDGFGATRQIRSIEESRRKRSSSGTDGVKDVKTPALIIAFTGRSSIEDQTEAVRVGIDLFMTKPVAFKEVGKIIDNWLANKEREHRVSAASTGTTAVP
jgi:CheY-like chemotaxis protein